MEEDWHESSSGSEDSTSLDDIKEEAFPPPATSLVFKQVRYKQRQLSHPDDDRSDHGEDVTSQASSTLAKEIKQVLEDYQLALQARLDALMLRQEEVVGRLLQQPAFVPRAAGASRHTQCVPRRSGSTSPSSPLAGRSSTRHAAAIAMEALASGAEAQGPLSRAYQRRSVVSATRSDSETPPPKTPPPMTPDQTKQGSGSGRRSIADIRGSVVTQIKTTDSGFKWSMMMTGEAWFDILSTSMIIINSLVIGVETEYMTYHNGRSHVGFIIGQFILNLYFTLELIGRVAFDKGRFFTSSDWKWNIFDAILVALSIVDVVQIVAVGLDNGVMSTGRLMRIIRLGRLVRTMRLCRSLTYIHQFRKMVYSLRSSLTTLGWSLLLLTAVMYAFAVLFVQAVAEYTYMSEDPNSTASQETLESLEEFYGNMFKAYVTLYKAVSNGQSWTILMEPLVEVDPSFLVLFIVYITIVFFGVLNVVSAVFVESAMASTSHYKDLRIFEARKAKQELVRHMKEVFMQIDEDKSGEISFEEMDHFLTDPQLKMYVESLEVSVEDTAMLFQLMDLDDSGVVDIDEFCTGLLRLQGEARSFDVQLLIFEMSKWAKKWSNFEDDVSSLVANVMSKLSDLSSEKKPKSLEDYGSASLDVELWRARADTGTAGTASHKLSSGDEETSPGPASFPVTIGFGSL